MGPRLKKKKLAGGKSRDAGHTDSKAKSTNRGAPPAGATESSSSTSDAGGDDISSAEEEEPASAMIVLQNSNIRGDRLDPTTTGPPRDLRTIKIKLLKELSRPRDRWARPSILPMTYLGHIHPR